MFLGRHAALGSLGILMVGCAIARPVVPPVVPPVGGDSQDVSLTSLRGTPVAAAAVPASASPVAFVPVLATPVAASPAATGNASPGPAAPGPAAPGTAFASMAPAGTASPDTASPGTAPPGGASPTPAATVQSTPAPSGTATPTPSGNPFGMPKPLELPLPSALAGIGFAGLIGNNGGAILSNNGGSLVPLTKLITDNGAGVVSTGGAAYRLAQATTAPSATPAIPLPASPVAPGQAAANVLRSSLNTLIVEAKAANSFLFLATLTGLQPGVPQVSVGSSGNPMTVLLSVHPTHATLSLYQAASADPAKRVATISYTKPTRVRFALEPRTPEGGHARWLEEYDLETGMVVADGVIASAPDAAGLTTTVVGRWELTPPGPADPAGSSYTFRHASWTTRTNDPFSPHAIFFATNFDAAGRAASWYATGNAATGGNYYLAPADGVSLGLAPPAPYGFYMEPNGLDLPADAAPAELKALLPSLQTVMPPLPPKPGEGDPFARPDLDFLD